MHNDALRYLLIWTFYVIKVHVKCNIVVMLWHKWRNVVEKCTRDDDDDRV